jgi:hypothetical protein
MKNSGPIVKSVNAFLEQSVWNMKKILRNVVSALGVLGYLVAAVLTLVFNVNYCILFNTLSKQCLG